MITNVYFRNYRCLRCVRTTLEPFTVFVGKNGSGKSTILRALHTLFSMNDMTRLDLDDRTRGATSGIELAAETTGGTSEYLQDQGILVRPDDWNKRVLSVLTRTSSERDQVIAIHTLRTSGRPWLLLIDNMDANLHPVAQRTLMERIREELAANPNLQVVAATHSPYLVHFAEVQEVRVLELRADGSTVCAPLSEHPKWARLSSVFSPGEFWEAKGETWATEIDDKKG